MSAIKPQKKPFDNLRIALESAYVAADFIKRNRVWEGFFSYKWIVKGLMWMGALLGVGVLYRLYVTATSQQSLFDAMGVSDLFSLEWLVDLSRGSGNYVILIAIEIIIFHFSRRTMMLITDKDIDTSWMTFVKAEIRMIRVVVFAFVMELLLKIPVSIVCSIFGWDSIEQMLLILIHCFYLGFAIIDNYNELYGMTISQSHKYTKHYTSIALVVGVIMATLLNLPIAGSIIAPILCAVIATLAMNRVYQRDQTMDWAMVKNKAK